jgi:hypothetical protein
MLFDKERKMIHDKIGIFKIYKIPKSTLLSALFSQIEIFLFFYCYLLRFQHDNLPKNEIIQKKLEIALFTGGVFY